jgi:hypothetical protein
MKLTIEEAYLRGAKPLDMELTDEENGKRIILRFNIRKHAYNVLPMLLTAANRLIELNTTDERRYVTGARNCQHDEWCKDHSDAISALEHAVETASTVELPE